MFTAKKNNIKPSNPALKDGNKSPFIKPEMKVVKPEAKQEDKLKNKVKETQKKPKNEVATFFAPTKTKTDKKGAIKEKGKEKEEVKEQETGEKRKKTS